MPLSTKERLGIVRVQHKTVLSVSSELACGVRDKSGFPVNC